MESRVGHEVVELIIIVRVSRVVVGDESLDVALQEFKVEVGRHSVGEFFLPVHVSCDDQLSMWTPVFEKFSEVL